MGERWFCLQLHAPLHHILGTVSGFRGTFATPESKDIMVVATFCLNPPLHWTPINLDWQRRPDAAEHADNSAQTHMEVFSPCCTNLLCLCELLQRGGHCTVTCQAKPLGYILRMRNSGKHTLPNTAHVRPVKVRLGTSKVHVVEKSARTHLRREPQTIVDGEPHVHFI